VLLVWVAILWLMERVRQTGHDADAKGRQFAGAHVAAFIIVAVAWSFMIARGWIPAPFDFSAVDFGRMAPGLGVKPCPNKMARTLDGRCV